MKTSDTATCRQCKDCNNSAEMKRKLEREKYGLCIKCGVGKPLPGVQKRSNSTNRCEKCILKHAAWTYLKSSKRWTDLKSIFDQQEGKCSYTGRDIIIGIDAELDHIIPRSKGGDNKLDNLQWVHTDVNKMKSYQLPDDFLKLIAEIYHHSGLQ